jgi:hypothetical protein
MQFIGFLLGTTLLCITLPIWGGALGMLIGTGFYLLVNHFWILLAITVGMFAIMAKAG